MNNLIHAIYTNILDGDHKSITTNVNDAILAAIPPSDILHAGMISAMSEVGHRFEIGEYYVPEMLISARAMQTGLSILKPHLIKADIKPIGKIAIGTVRGDLHDIGKNLVSMMLEGAGFEVIDLGTDVPAEKFLEAAHGVDIIAMSALLTTTMQYMKTVIDCLGKAGVRDKLKIIVGGAPITEDYAQSIGADGYAPDAGRAAALVKSVVSK